MASFEKRGKKWRAVVSVMENNNRKKLSKTFDLKREAVEWATDLESLRNNGQNLIQSNMLLTEYFEIWFNQYKKNDVRESTQLIYTNASHNVAKYFSDLTLDNLTTFELQSRLDVYASGHKFDTTKMLWAKIKASLKDAKLDGYINQDVWSRVKNHSVRTKTTVEALSAKDFEKFQSYLYANLDDRYNLLYLLALETGARLGELLALTPSDFSWTFKKININKSFSSTTRKVTETKNLQSHRKVSISDQLIIAIKPLIKPNDPIFKTNVASTVNRVLKEKLAENDIAYHHFHTLRHSHASYLLHKGVSIEYVSMRLGHKNTKITLEVYAHMLKEKEQAQNELALDILSGTKSPNVPNIRAKH